MWLASDQGHVVVAISSFGRSKQGMYLVHLIWFQSKCPSVGRLLLDGFGLVLGEVMVRCWVIWVLCWVMLGDDGCVEVHLLEVEVLVLS